jgi:hypothetical protein
VKPDYKDLYFGKSDSLNEITSDEDEFIKSFVDLDSITEDIVNAEKTLVLGPKGTGKSALAWYLDKTGRNNGRRALVVDASVLPLAEIPRISTGQAEGTERTVTAWSFILLCNYLDLLLSDPDCRIPNKTEVVRVTRLLRKYGLMGRTSGRAILDLSTTSVEIPAPRNASYKQDKPLNIFSLLPILENWVSNAQSPNRHQLLLDGLDSIFLNDKKYNESLAALVQASYTLNQMLNKNKATGSIILLIRNDVFSRISNDLPDSQKMRDDFAIELDWRILSGAQGVRAPLIRLVNQKAAKALSVESVDVLSYFPSRISLGSKASDRQVDRLQYFLNMTRHTPRDLLRLFEEIRKVEKSGNFVPSNNGLLSLDVIREGVLQYSTKYFTGAIRNELAGADQGTGEASRAISALQSLERQKFTFAEFTAALEESGECSPELATRLITLLFFAGAVGNTVEIRGGSYMQFYHRRDDTSIYLKGTLILHTALAHAWSIPFTQ